jgi:hypothetical protein
MNTTLFWKRSSGMDGAATRKRPTSEAAGELGAGIDLCSSKSMGIVRAKIKMPGAAMDKPRPLA